MSGDNVTKHNKTSLVAISAIGLAVIFILIKAWLFYTTQATSFMASLLDSAMDVGLSGATLIGIYWAAKPSNARHRYGYGKVEALLGLLQSIFLSLAALVLAWTAGSRLAEPQTLSASLADIILTCTILFANGALILWQSRVIKETGSLAIKGDRAHYISDIFSNAALLLLLVIDVIIPTIYLDPLFTLIISVILLLSAIEHMRNCANILLDKEADEEVREEIFVAASMVKGVAGIHDLRVIDSGARLGVSLDVEVDGDLSLITAHDISRDVENVILALAPGAEIMIHIDPVGEREDSRHVNLKPMHFT